MCSAAIWPTAVIARTSVRASPICRRVWDGTSIRHCLSRKISSSSPVSSVMARPSAAAGGDQALHFIISPYFRRRQGAAFFDNFYVAGHHRVFGLCIVFADIACQHRGPLGQPDAALGCHYTGFGDIGDHIAVQLGRNRSFFRRRLQAV